MATSAAASSAASERQGRRKQVEAALLALGRPVAMRRLPPPEGRLGAGEDYGVRLRQVLVGLGPVFAAFGRYLAARVDLLPRRARTELSAIPDAGAPLSPAAVSTLIRRELGGPIDRLFFEFQGTPFAVGLWTERHLAWLSPGVPAAVTIVRPDAAADIEVDMPLLPLLAPWLDVPADLLAAAVADFALTLLRRLDQTHLAASLAALAVDARTVAGFDAPACYRDHSSASILTVEQISGETLDECADAGEALARRVAGAWLRQAFAGSVVPYDFSASDILIAGDRLVLTGGAFEPHVSAEHAHFEAYMSAVAADDPNAAATWLVEGSDLPQSVEDELRRLLRKAVPFRDGEWSGDDRLAEHVLVQWRVARDAGWPLSAHRQHLYRGLHAIAHITYQLAPNVDTLLGALEDERLRTGMAHAGRLMDPRHVQDTLDRTLQQLIELPQKLDDVLTLAAEGRLRMKLHVPETDEAEHVRNRTVMLVTSLVAFAGAGTVLRHLVPVFGASIERIGAVVLLLLGGWLLIAAAQL